MEITYQIKTKDNISPLIAELNQQLQLNIDSLGELRELLFDLVNFPLKLVSIETRTARGTVEALLNPSDLLLDLLSAIRTGDFENFAIKGSHDVAS